MRALDFILKNSKCVILPACTRGSKGVARSREISKDAVVIKQANDDADQSD